LQDCGPDAELWRIYSCCCEKPSFGTAPARQTGCLWCTGQLYTELYHKSRTPALAPTRAPEGTVHIVQTHQDTQCALCSFCCCAARCWPWCRLQVGPHADSRYQARTQSAAGAAMHLQPVHAAMPSMWRIGCLLCILRPPNSRFPFSTELPNPPGWNPPVPMSGCMAAQHDDPVTAATAASACYAAQIWSPAPSPRPRSMALLFC